MSTFEHRLWIGKIREWQSKAHAEQDPFNKYLSIFIAYNILYNLYWKTLHPKGDLTYGDKKRSIDVLDLVSAPTPLVERLPRLSEYVDFIPIYREEYWDGKNGIPISAALLIAFREGWAMDTLEMLVKWLYKVRCNLIHGDKDYEDALQRRLLSASSDLLDVIVSELLLEYSRRSGISLDLRS